jgi:hypothetical protein
MRVRKLSMLVLATAAAGLALTACDGNASTDSAASPSSSATPAAGTGTPDANAPRPAAGTPGSGTGQNASGGGTGSTGTGGGNGQAPGGTTCETAHLAFTSSHGMAEGEWLINLKNTGTHTCTMHGFPGADLKGGDGTISAARSTVAAPHVTLRPGEETRFTLHYPVNDSGGSGVTFTTLIVTPPNETHSHTMPLTVNVPVTDGSSAPGVTVDPVGAGK